MDPDRPLPMAIFMDIDRAAPIPLYFQIASRLETAIIDGTVPAGARIDNEIALSERLGISRPTVRRAIQDLVDKGLLVRRRGIGTQVVHGEVTRKVELTSLFEDLTAANRAPSTRVIARAQVNASDKIALKLGVPVGSPTLHIRRVRLADDVPLALMENYLPRDFLDISESDFTQFGLNQLLSARGVNMRVARQRIGARSATAEESSLLEIDRRSALLTLDSVSFDSNGRAVDFGHHSYRPDLYSFEVTLVGK